MATARDLIARIARHPAVQRATDHYGRQKLTAAGINLAALDPLLKLKRTRSSWLAARRNAREEAPLAARHESAHGPGSAHEAGYAVETPDPPALVSAQRRCAEALGLGGLPADLAALCRELLELDA